LEKDNTCRDRMTIDFVIIVVIMVTISLLKPDAHPEKHKMIVDKEEFRVSTGFVAASVIILGTLAALYTVFW
jgi:SSS family solute:Na+ symporter